MMNDPFSRKPPKPFHSSAYARVSRGGAMGSGSAQTFGQRTHIERNRSAISRYSNSKIGLGYIHRSGKTDDNTTTQSRHQPAIMPRQTGGKRPGLHRSERQSFNEPTVRRNPYS